MKQILKRRDGKTLSFHFIFILKENILSFPPIGYNKRKTLLCSTNIALFVVFLLMFQTENLITGEKILI